MSSAIQLLNGDCIRIMKTLPDKSVDCFICDLPYGQLSKGDATFDDRPEHWVPKITGCDWDVKLNLKDFWEQIDRLKKNDHTPVLHFCNTKFGIELINSNPKWFHYDLVWNKERGVSFLTANKLPMKSHEMIYIFSKKGPYYKRVDVSGNFTPYGAHNTEAKSRTVVVAGGGRNKTDGNDGTKRCALSVINVKKPNTKGHPTEKPKELYRWLLERYCPEGGVVLDPTAGSFNSIEVARDLGLTGIGIEMDKGFYDKAVARLTPPPTESAV
jgi:site-specific DNA-methyltransferase (adenine-specific)